MTADITGGNLTDAARQALERYVRELRILLQGCPTVDPAEVEAEVRQHIDQELADAPQPVSSERLGAVLTKLGSPAQWVPLDELPWWRRTMIKLRIGPASDRWAVAVFAVWVLGVLLVPAAGLGLVLVLASFLLARAMMAMSQEAGEQLGWHRWLVYPPLLSAYLPVLVIKSFWVACTSGIPFIISEGEKVVGKLFELRRARAESPSPSPVDGGGSQTPAIAHQEDEYWQTIETGIDGRKGRTP